VLAESLGASFHSVIGDDIPRALLEFAQAHNATQIVLGGSRRSPLRAALTGAGVGATVTRLSGTIDVHMVSHDYIGKGRGLPKLGGGLTPRRRWLGALAAGVALLAITPAMAALRSHTTLASDALIYLVAVVIVALIGGIFPAVAAAVASGLLLNWYFAPPIHSFTIYTADNVIAVIVYLVVAVLVSAVVDVAARRSTQAARASAEAETLFTLAGSLLRGEEALPALLERILETFGMSAVSLLQRTSEAPASEGATGLTDRSGSLRGTWSCLASVGDQPCLQPGEGDIEVPVQDNLALVLRGRPLPAEDRRVLAAFAAEVAVAYQQRQLREAAAAAIPAREADRMRTALLNAVSHDLRSPLAIAKATVTSLRSADVHWRESDRRQLLESADIALDRLTELVTNLLDLSRLQADVLSVFPRPLGLEDVVNLAVSQLGAPAGTVDIDVPTDLPDVMADPGLLERVIANIVQNALRYSPAGKPVLLSGSTYGSVIELRVVDRGPGIPEAEREQAFAPFQRRDDLSTTGSPGVGLGLAIARGFTEAMGGSLTMDDTPGGGLTVIISLPVAKPETPAM
jgi:two-component system sensor histidine kinase KdpD